MAQNNGERILNKEVLHELNLKIHNLVSYDITNTMQHSNMCTALQ